jgi:hypothetical protein
MKFLLVLLNYRLPHNIWETIAEIYIRDYWLIKLTAQLNQLASGIFYGVSQPKLVRRIEYSQLV